MPHSDHFIHATPKKIKKKKFGLFENLVVIVSVVYPLSALPQAWQVFHGHADGVSLLSWFSFLTCAALFLAYGIKHKVPPMIISNSLWILTDSLVIIGVIIQQNT